MEANRLNFKLLIIFSIMPRPRPLSMNNDHNKTRDLLITLAKQDPLLN